jgi:uncharacterized membrane protein
MLDIRSKSADKE